MNKYNNYFGLNDMQDSLPKAKIKDMLLKAQPFQYLTPAELDKLLLFCKIVSFQPGEIILRQGKKNDCMYVIIEGQAQVFAQILGSGMVLLATLNHNDFIGEIELIEKELAAVTVIAETPMQCLLISNEYFNTILLFFPEIRYKITKAIVDGVSIRLQEIFAKIKLYMEQSDMSAWVSIEEIMKSLTKPKLMEFSQIGITRERLEKLEVFKSFSKDEFDIILNGSNFVKVSNNYVLIDEEKKSASFYVIIFGAVEVNISQQQKRAKVAVLGPGQFFGGTACITDSPSIVTYITRERALLLEIKNDKLELLQKEHIVMWYKFYGLICKSLIALEKAAGKLFIRFHSETYNR